MKYVFQISDHPHTDIIRAWEEHMQESWSDYDGATRFVQLEKGGDGIAVIGGFAVYWDNSEGVEGHFVSGWSQRKNLSSVKDVILSLADKLGEVYIKTNKRQVRFVAQNLGKLVKKTDGFWYYVIKGDKHGKTE